MMSTFKVKYAHRDACQLCGLHYVKKSKTDQIYHRAYHAKIARLVFPKPLKRFIARVQKIADFELVTESSPVWMHKQMYARARVFQKEFGYDFAQWSDGRDGDLNPHGFLLRGDTVCGENCIVGACAFREYSPGIWTLTWVWVCPESRRTGILCSRWKDFLRRFGDFTYKLPTYDGKKNAINVALSYNNGAACAFRLFSMFRVCSLKLF